MTVRKGTQGLRGKTKVRAQTTHSRRYVTTRADGTVYHQDRVRWPASLGTFRYADAETAAADLLKEGDDA